MSTKGSVSETFFRARLLLLLAIAGAAAGFFVGNRIEFRALAATQVPVVHEFEIGAVLAKLKSCGIPRALHWIS